MMNFQDKRFFIKENLKGLSTDFFEKWVKQFSPHAVDENKITM